MAYPQNMIGADSIWGPVSPVKSMGVMERAKQASLNSIEAFMTYPVDMP